MGRARVAYAVAKESVVVLGQPATRGLWLKPDCMERRELDFVGDASEATSVVRWQLPWTALRSATVETAVTDRRRPGLWPMLVATTLEVVGAAGIPGTADVVVRLEVRDGDHEEVRDIECDGFVGKGYWRGDAVALQALLGLLVGEPRTRAHLDRPRELLDAVAAVGAVDPDAASAAADLRARLC